MAFASYSDRPMWPSEIAPIGSEGSDPESLLPKSRSRRHHGEPERATRRIQREAEKSQRSSRPEKEVSHHRRTQQSHLSRSKSSHKKKEPSGFLGSVLKWTAGANPPPKNDRRYYDSSNAWVRKPEHSSRSRSHRHHDSRKHREHKETRPRSLDREHRHRERRDRGEHESSREHRGERKHRSREHKSEREHRSRKDGERREHRSDRERREHRSDREKREHREHREHRSKRQHHHEEPRVAEVPNEQMFNVQMLPSDETASQVQTRLYKESAEVMGYDIRDATPVNTDPYAQDHPDVHDKGKGVHESNPYGDFTWSDLHPEQVAYFDVPSGTAKTQNIIRERMSRRKQESAAEAAPAPMPAPAESQISPKSKWPPAFETPAFQDRRTSYRPLSPVSINRPQSQEIWDSAPRPPTPTSPTSEYDDESVHSLENEEELYETIANPKRSSVQHRGPPPAMLNNSNRNALNRASRSMRQSGPPPAMLNRGSFAPPMGRRPSALDRQSWRPASSVYSQDPPPVDTDVDIERGVRDDEVTPLDSISCAPRRRAPPPTQAFSHASAAVPPLALPRGSVYNRAAQMNPESYAGTEWPGVPPQQGPGVLIPGLIDARTGIPIQSKRTQQKPLKTAKKGVFSKLKGMF